MVDATQGEGGHSSVFLSQFPDLHIIGIDADKSIQKIAKKRLEVFGDRVTFYSGWSQDFFLGGESFPSINTVLIDLGVSLFHYTQSGRGFSFAKDEPLDMRLDTSAGQSAADVVATLSERDLADLLFNNAEERYSRRIARGIVEARSCGSITSSAALADIVSRSVPTQYRYGRIHPATKTFLALRTVVNRERSSLPSLLEAALKSLKQGGRLGVITFHSIEDRMVKYFFREKAQEGGIGLVNKKAIKPSFDELKQNPPSRSALLRVIQKIK
jgi:16S rRNA (cytosine1402-N4)-methyltransferase